MRKTKTRKHKYIPICLYANIHTKNKHTKNTYKHIYTITIIQIKILKLSHKLIKHTHI